MHSQATCAKGLHRASIRLHRASIRLHRASISLHRASISLHRASIGVGWPGHVYCLSHKAVLA